MVDASRKAGNLKRLKKEKQLPRQCIASDTSSAGKRNAFDNRQCRCAK
jgi:hypothetical protein